jgi:hypothetical protein
MVTRPDVMTFTIGTLASAASRLTASMAIGDNRSSRVRSQDFSRASLLQCAGACPGELFWDRATTITAVTKLTADKKCVACGGLLVPPVLASVFLTPPGADYVCLACGRPYHWTTGNPPKLTVLEIERRGENDDED